MRARTAPAVGLALLLLALLIVPGACGSGDDSTIVPSASTTMSGATTSNGVRGVGAMIAGSAGGQAVIRLGAVFPLSGDLAAQGEDSVRGLRLAVAEVNAGGGVHSLGGASLALVEADSRGDPQFGADEAERLVSKEGVSALIGTFQSTVALPVAETAERLEVPFIVSTAAADSITERGYRYTFRLCPKAEWYARDQVSFLADPPSMGGREVKKVALLHEDGTFGQATAAAQRRYLDKAGIEVVAEISYPAQAADLSEEILQIKAGGAQAVLTATYLDDAVLIAQSAQRLRLRLPILDAAGGTTDAAFIAGAGDGAEAMITESEYSPGTSALRVEEAMAATTGQALGAAGLYAYQAVWLLASALERAGSATPERLRSALAATAMPAGERMVLPQTLLAFDGSGQNRYARLFVVQFQDSKPVPLWPGEYRKATPRLP